MNIEEIKREYRKYFNWMNMKLYQNHEMQIQAIIKGTFILLHAHIVKESSQIIYLSLFLRTSKRNKLNPKETEERK